MWWADLGSGHHHREEVSIILVVGEWAEAAEGSNEGRRRASEAVEALDPARRMEWQHEGWRGLIRQGGRRGA